MLYLEDYLEMIEHLPHELRDRFTEMREMDIHVHNEMDTVDEKVKVFFSNAKKMKAEQRDSEYTQLKQEYEKTLEEAEEKMELANQIYDLVERYLKRLDSELQKFKIELEADNSGITEILERRSLELDNPPSSGVNNVREKRKHSHNESIQGVPISVRSGDTSGSGSNHGVSNNVNNNWVNPATFTNSLSNLVNNPNVSSNGNPLLANTLTSPHSPSFYSLGAGSTAIAAAASQAIAATQQMQQGRRTASLKASYEAINAGLPNISCDFNALREGSISSFNSQSGNFNSGGEGSSTGLYKATKRSRTSSSQFQDTDESSETLAVDENGAPVDWTFDPNEPRYCLCNQVSYGDMVACDNADCQYEWFHYGCVGITQPPRGKWFCPPCTLQMKRKNRKDKV